MYERSYHKKVLTQKAPPEKKRRRRFPWRKVKKIFIGLIIVAVVVALIRVPQLRVRDVEVVGTSVVDPEDVSLFVRSQIEGNFLYLFPKSSMLLVPTASVAKWTTRQFPRFSSVDVRRKGVHGLTITVTEYEGTYLWCTEEPVPAAAEGDTVEAAPDSRCFFMTREGLVFAPAPFFSGNAYPKIYIGAAQELPFTPLTAAQLASVQLLLERLPSVGINPIAIRAVSEHETDVEFSHYGSSARLLLDPANDTAQAIENLATALATEPLKSHFKTSAKVLDYMDARFANKVVYKFK